MVILLARTEDGQHYYLEVDLNCRLKKLREKLEEVTHIPRGHQKVIFSHPSSFHDCDVEKAKAKGCLKWWMSRHFIPKAPEKKKILKQKVMLTISHVK